MTPLCALVIGHHPEAPGATSVSGETEYDYNSDMAERVAKRVHPSTCELVRVRREQKYTMPYREVNGTGCDFFLSLHFNGWETPTPRGAEMLYCSVSSESKRFAEILQSQVLGALQLPSRGLRAVGHREHDPNDVYRANSLLWKTRMPGVLAEPGFGSNPDDWRALDEWRGLLASAYARSIMQYARHITNRDA